MECAEITGDGRSQERQDDGQNQEMRACFKEKDFDF
jgi:hypothetical protein